MPGSSLNVIPGCERQRVPLHQVGPLVAVHAQAVAHPVREVLVAGAVAGVLDDRARGGVDGLARHAGPRGLQRRRLRAPDDVEHRSILSVGLPSTNVRLMSDA